MPVYPTTIEHILRAYSQHAKSGRGTTAEKSEKGSFLEALQSSMTTQRRKKLEQLALENMVRITRKTTGTPEK